MSLQSDGMKYFIPGLPPGVQPDELSRYFAVFGQVLSADVRSGAGYVTMHNDAPHSEIVMDKHEIGGKSLRALMSKESLQAADVKKVHLGKLSEYIAADTIRAVLAKFGTVLDVHTPKDPHTGQRKNFGFATFDTDDAFNACLQAGSVEIDGCFVDIKPANQTQATPGEDTARSKRDGDGIKYFVPGLPMEITDSDLKTHFSAYGEVTDAHIVQERGTNVSRGFGYITMADRGSQEAMLTGNHSIAGKPIQVQLTKDSLAGGGVKKVHLGDLDENTTAEQIREVFSTFGLVVDVHTPKFPDSGKRKNFGFVTFVADDAFDKAVAAGTVNVAGKPVTVKPAAQSEAGYSKGGKDGGKGGKGGKDAYKGKGDDWSSWGPYGKGGGKDAWDPWSSSYGYDKGYGKGYADPWAGKGYGKSEWDPWGGKGYGKPEWDPWAGKGDGWGKGGWDSWGGKGWDAGKGGPDPWGGKGGKDPWGKGGKDQWGGGGGDWSKGGGGDPWGKGGGGDPWGKGGGGYGAAKGGWDGKGKAGPY